MCKVSDEALENAYMQGYMDSYDEPSPVNGIGAFSLDNFPTMLVGATVANQIASKDELLNVHLDKLGFLQGEDGAVKKEYRGGLKILGAGLGLMYTKNQIAQGALLGVVLSGANDLYDYARDNKMFGLSGPGVGSLTPAQEAAEPEMIYSGLNYDDFGMNGYESYEEVHEQEADLEDNRNAMRI